MVINEVVPAKWGEGGKERELVENSMKKGIN